MKSDSNITIKEVLDGDELKKFVMFPHTLYKNSKYWVAPIIKEELEVLNKETNPLQSYNIHLSNIFLVERLNGNGETILDKIINNSIKY